MFGTLSERGAGKRWSEDRSSWAGRAMETEWRGASPLQENRITWSAKRGERGSDAERCRNRHLPR